MTDRNKTFGLRLLYALTPVILIAIGANALMAWRTLAILENDLAHLTVDVAEIKGDLKELRRWSSRPPARLP